MEPLELAGVRTPTELGQRLGGLTMGGSLTMLKCAPCECMQRHKATGEHAMRRASLQCYEDCSSMLCSSPTALSCTALRSYR